MDMVANCKVIESLKYICLEWNIEQWAKSLVPFVAP